MVQKKGAVPSQAHAPSNYKTRLYCCGVIPQLHCKGNAFFLGAKIFTEKFSIYRKIIVNLRIIKDKGVNYHITLN